VAEEAIISLRLGRSVVIHSALGPQDPRISRTKRLAESLGMASQDTVDILGKALGELARRCVLTTRVRRLVLSGGDTAGRITQTLASGLFRWRIRRRPGSALLRVFDLPWNERAGGSL